MPLSHAILGCALLLGAYAYAGYPLLLLALARTRRRSRPLAELRAWPPISITVPAYNEEAEIGAALEGLLKLDYPADRRQILVVSDASTDRTDEIVRSFADRGVELLRLPERRGKTAAEAAAAPLLTGTIVVNTDASIRIPPGSLKALIAPFGDPEVGLASGRDLSVARHGTEANIGESRYVGYEMWVRALETRVGGIVGASGCFYAIRAHLHRAQLPDALSRDFAAALVTRENDLRAVSVDEAVCLVPRTGSLRQEYRRKVRTMTRGMETLLHKRALLNPFRYGLFSWMLVSHKVCRWAVPWALVAGVLSLGALAAGEVWARWALGAILAAGMAALLALAWPEKRPIPRVLALPAFLMMGNLAALHSSLKALHQDRNATWEPTRRHAGA